MPHRAWYRKYTQKPMKPKMREDIWRLVRPPVSRNLLRLQQVVSLPFAHPRESYRKIMFCAKLAAVNLRDLDEKPHKRSVPARLPLLRTHESKDFFGALHASLPSPLGFNEESQSGYHPAHAIYRERWRGLLAAGATIAASAYCITWKPSRRRPGHWAQNMWLRMGRPYWNGR